MNKVRNSSLSYYAKSGSKLSVACRRNGLTGHRRRMGRESCSATWSPLMELLRGIVCGIVVYKHIASLGIQSRRIQLFWAEVELRCLGLSCPK